MSKHFRNYSNSDRQKLVEQTYKKMYTEQTLKKKNKYKIISYF